MRSAGPAFARFELASSLLIGVPMSADSVLVIEDHPATLKLMRLLMMGAGYEVKTAISAEQALYVLLEFQPSVILLDLELPTMSGMGLARLLRAAHVLDHTRLIAVSAEWELENAARDAGCHEYLPKPVDSEELLAAVAHAVAHVSRKEDVQ
jgi:CheY-like chemotaxis protein